MGHADGKRFVIRADGIVEFRATEVRRSAELPHGFADDHGGSQRDVQAAAAAAHRDQQARIGAIVDGLRHACRFAAEEQDIAIGEGEVRIDRFGPGREQHEPAPLGPPLLLEARKIDVPGEGSHFEIIHPGAAERAIARVEAGRTDEVDGEAETGRHAQDGAGVAGNVGLVEGYSDGGGQVWSQNKALQISHIVRRLRQNCTLRVANFVEAVYRARRVHSNLRRREWNS